MYSIIHIFVFVYSNLHLATKNKLKNGFLRCLPLFIIALATNETTVYLFAVAFAGLYHEPLKAKGVSRTYL
jgi:hypothetical protein